MSLETAVNLLNYIIVVCFATIIFSPIYAFLRAHRIVKKINKREQEFMNSVYFKLKTKEWEKLNAAVPNNLQLKDSDDNPNL